MDKVRALRGVCIAVEKHLLPGDEGEVEPGLATFLVSIGAVERVVPVLPETPPEQATAPAPEPPAPEVTTASAPAKHGKKEK